MLRCLFAIFAAAALLSGCANHHTEKYFDPTVREGPPTVGSASSGDRVTVHFFRPRAWAQALIYIPIPPRYFAVNGKLTSIMPLGSYVTLSLEPGLHTFSSLGVSGGGLFPLEVGGDNVMVDLKLGRIYYVGTPTNAFAKKLIDEVDEATGKAALAESRPARLLHQPVDVATFKRRLAILDRGGKRPESTTAPPKAAEQPGGAALGSQVTEFLEGIATVALVALLIFGAAAGAAAAQGPAVPTYQPPEPPGINSPVANQTWNLSSGSAAMIVDNSRERIVRVVNTGVNYRIEGNRIYGSDGSRYRQVGNTFYSDSGESYQVIGNNVFTSDGRTCLKTGVIVSCNR